MTYKVECYQKVRGLSSDNGKTDVVLGQKFLLPFIPMVGMLFIWGDWECFVEGLHYDIDLDTFIVYPPVDCSVEDASKLKYEKPTVEEVVQDYLDLGWIRVVLDETREDI